MSPICANCAAVTPHNTVLPLAHACAVVDSLPRSMVNVLLEIAITSTSSYSVASAFCMVSRYTSPLVSDKPAADVTDMLVALTDNAALSVVLQLFINLNAISSAHKNSPAICEAWLIL